MEKLDNYDNLIISRKTTSIVAAMLIVLGTFAFIAGYFWGYRRASSGVQAHIDSVGFVDQVNKSINKEFGSEGMLADSGDIKIDSNAKIDSSDLVKKDLSKPKKTNNDTVISTEYYAELIGFGYLKAAQKFVDQAKKKGYPVHLRKRVGKTGGGKTISWYQAVTKKFADKAELDKLLKAIKKTENIKQGIKIKNS